MLDETKLDELQKQHSKIGVIEFSGHQIVFRKPTRFEAREYKRMMESEAEKPDAIDRLCQSTIIALDGETDPTRAREAFTGSFLEAYPLATAGAKFKNVLGALTGLVEDEDARELGKGARIKGLPPPTLPKA